VDPESDDEFSLYRPDDAKLDVGGAAKDAPIPLPDMSLPLWDASLPLLDASSKSPLLNTSTIPHPTPWPGKLHEAPTLPQAEKAANVLDILLQGELRGKGGGYQLPITILLSSSGSRECVLISTFTPIPAQPLTAVGVHLPCRLLLGLGRGDIVHVSYAYFLRHCKGDPKPRNSLRLARGNPKFIR
jgi:hypothetical protein